MTPLTPSEIVEALDEHIVGQADAKRAVAIAVRNRWRWERLDSATRREIAPKNILMVGPTGVGKTETARRLARLVDAPFAKVEATKFTEVGYYGRDVESMVRDLIEAAARMIRVRMQEEVADRVQTRVEERLLGALFPQVDVEGAAPIGDTREKFRGKLRDGSMEDREIEVTVEKNAPMPTIPGLSDTEAMDFGDLFGRMLPKSRTTRKVAVREAREIFAAEEANRLVDKDSVYDEAIRRAETSGILFIDEIDKVCETGKNDAGVSRQGVQRDLLPIVEGTTIQTKWGPIRTDKILFIAAGAFQNASPSDLMPELQGRFPVRVQLEGLTREDFVRILTEPAASLPKQYAALLAEDGVTLEFDDEALESVAEAAFEANERDDDIGARRLHTVMEQLLEDLSFDAPELSGTTVRVDRAYVKSALGDFGKRGLFRR